MRSAIAEIVRATRHSDSSSLLKAIRAAADVAGVDTSDLDFRESGRCTRTTEKPETSKEICIIKPSKAEGVTSPATPENPANRSLSPARRDRGPARRPSATARPSGRLSPRLDYGLWVDASLATPIVKPPSEIIPYLGAGRYTFAGHLYWACADYVISLCRLVTAPHAPTPWFGDGVEGRPCPGEAEARVWRALRHSPPLRSVRLAQALAEAQREYLESGYIRGDSPACDDQIGALLRREVEADYVARGCDLTAWMTIVDLEKHVRRRLGAEAFARLEVAIASYRTPPRPENAGLVPDEDARALVRLLIKNLAESAVCFGDGPRWRADCLADLFSSKTRGKT